MRSGLPRGRKREVLHSPHCVCEKNPKEKRVSVESWAVRLQSCQKCGVAQPGYFAGQSVTQLDKRKNKGGQLGSGKAKG